jgi:hypothetical protein
MRRALSLVLLSLAVAPAAQAATPSPVVKSVSPLRASVGEVMTISGRYFQPGESQNVVVFVNGAGKVVYVRADNATTDSMSLRLPKKLERLMNSSGGKKVATKFRVKVISSKMGKLASRALAKPTIGPDLGGDCDKDGIPNPEDTDDDNDVLYDDEEKRARTNPCLADSDGDQLYDGWEYLSALDLNRNALPYPGKKPFPNALFKDAEVDYDGDGMFAFQEHAMWWIGSRQRPLTYSDGTQYTTSEPRSNIHWWNDLGATFGILSDEERDFDGDGLANIIESRMYFFTEWGWPGVIRPDYLDKDTDGDGLDDGADDQDHDDISNIDEFLNGTWAMNPCDPLPSRTCPRWLEPGKEPQLPANVCMTQTALVQRGIRWMEFPEADPANPPDYCPVYTPPADLAR